MNANPVFPGPVARTTFPFNEVHEDSALRRSATVPSGGKADDEETGKGFGLHLLNKDLVRRFLIGFVPIVATTLVAWPFIPRRYEASAVVVLRPSDTGSSDDVRGWRHVLDENAIQSEIDHITSPRLADIVIARHNLTADPEFAKRDLLGFGSAKPVSEAEVRRNLNERLSVERERKSYTVKMGYWSSDPQKATAMTETLMTAYLDDQVARKREASTKVALWLRNEAEARESAYRESLGKVEELLERSGLMDTGERVAIDNQLATLSAEAAQVRSRIIEATIRVESLHARNDAGDLEHAPEVLSSPTVRRLKETLATAMSRSAVLGSETRAINAEIKAEAERILRATEIELDGLLNHEIKLQEAIERLRGKLVERRRNELKLEELNRRAAFDKEIYDEALKRVHSHHGRADVLTPDAEIVTVPQVPLRPAQPQFLLTMLASLVLATIAGAFVARRQLMAFAHRMGLVPHASTGEMPPVALVEDIATAPVGPERAAASARRF